MCFTCMTGEMDDSEDYYLGIEKEWFKYRDESIENIARRWCKENKIDYEE